jgi:carboxyl-terminal processing protease
MFKLNRFKIFTISILVGCISLASVTYDHYFEISKNLEIYASLFKELDVYYVDEIKPGDLAQKSIDAMLESLDPYTTFIPESEMEDHRLSTTGQYGGIGAVVRKRGDHVMITEPYENFPAQKAGLRAGDVILEVNGQSTKGKSTDEVVKILRGSPSSTAKLLIKREGVAEPMMFEVAREEIKIKNVPYHGMLDNEIGYIRLSGFTNNAGNDVKIALQELKKNDGLKGVVLDLRGNPGGLLREAINVVNVFVDKNINIVSTKGKVEEWNKTYKSLNEPVDMNIPLVVLVDRGSASASEIVSGSIQDLDRGVIIGQRTFGKGLVQSTRPLVYNTQLKVTTSKYYIPSGRCIQALDYSKKNPDGSAGVIPDSLRTPFKTSKGRTVYDGGGIYPDITIKTPTYSNVLRALLSKQLIFDYATQFRMKNETVAPAKEFQINDQQYDLFLDFLKDKKYEYTTDSEKILEDFKKKAEKEKYYESIKNEYELLVEKKKQSKNNDVIKFKDEIKSFLSEEIVSRYFYQKGRLENSLTTDEEVKKAIEVLKDKQKYKSILDGSYVIKIEDEEVEPADVDQLPEE